LVTPLLPAVIDLRLPSRSSSCDCGDTPISNTALAQYGADVASITFD